MAVFWDCRTALLETERETGDDVSDDTDASLAPPLVDLLLSHPDSPYVGLPFPCFQDPVSARSPLQCEPQEML